MIRVLADENVPRVSVRHLRAAGYDIASIAEIAPGASDSDVLQIARNEQRILVTFDRDFGELIYRKAEPAPSGVVFLRFIPHSPEEAAAVVRDLLSRAEIKLSDRFTVVTRDEVRQRPLP